MISPDAFSAEIIHDLDLFIFMTSKQFGPFSADLYSALSLASKKKDLSSNIAI